VMSRTATARGSGIRHRRPSLRLYLTALLVMFGLIAGGAAGYQRHRSLSSAEDETSAALAFRAKLGASEVDHVIRTTRKAVGDVAANPSLRQLFGPTITPGCTLAFGGDGPFTSGHIDIVSNQGSVRCSSRRLPDSAVYSGAAWLRSATTRPTVAGPVVDAATGRRVLVVTAPISGLGAVVTFLDLQGVTSSLSSRLSGPVDSRFSLVEGAGIPTDADANEPRIVATAPVASLGWATGSSGTFSAPSWPWSQLSSCST
jgi:hypothetical protein